MLKDRVVSAIVMLVAFVIINFFLPEPLFRLCLSLLAGVAAWEWSRLSGVRQENHQWLCGGILFLLTVFLWLVLPYAGIARVAALVGVLVWLGVVGLLVLAPARTLTENSIDWKALLAGAFLLILCVMFMDRLHGRDYGGSPWLLLYALSVVWVMDIGAYFSGKRFGRHKLAPLISPGKTWEGVVGGVCCAAVLALLTLMFSSFARDHTLVFFVGTVLAAAVSVVGDLFESRLKRAAGFKDSSQLIKGHGGILDRIDGVIAAIPVFGFAWTWL
ncbi:MAG: phosphatidate cytidylyltransferase [Gammaproteobacteria bacterium]|nr:phosphatidate cytidylyltransferase [Gammaproteobacteria bacterium]